MALHFVNFRGDEYWSGIRIWGLPDFIHRSYDRRCLDDVAPGDMIVFAQGDETQEVLPSWNDSNFFVDKAGKLWSMDNPKAPYPEDTEENSEGSTAMVG